MIAERSWCRVLGLIIRTMILSTYEGSQLKKSFWVWCVSGVVFIVCCGEYTPDTPRTDLFKGRVGY